MRTAADTSVQVQGQLPVDLRMGPLKFTALVHTLPSFTNEADIILGQDFMKCHHMVLDYETCRASSLPSGISKGLDWAAPGDQQTLPHPACANTPGPRNHGVGE